MAEERDGRTKTTGDGALTVMIGSPVNSYLTAPHMQLPEGMFTVYNNKTIGKKALTERLR